MVLGELNRDKIFVKKESGYWLHPLMHSQNDEYGDILLSGKAGGWFQEPEHLALTDGFIVFKEQEEEWFIGCSDRYLGDINEKDRQELVRIEECYCLCTVTDMGEIGTFQAKEIHSLIARLKKEPYRFSGECRGKLLGRGAGKDGFSRLLELQIPIELYV